VCRTRGGRIARIGPIARIARIGPIARIARIARIADTTGDPTALG
jgi:hypothetical protein